MNKLQQLLEDKYPIEPGIGPDERQHITSLRHSCTAGYNAAKEESQKVVQEMLDGPFSGVQFPDPSMAKGYHRALRDVQATLNTV